MTQFLAPAANRDMAMRTVADVMLTQVKLSGVATTVGEVRELFADEHVHSAVIVDDDGRLVTVVDRTDLPGRADHAAAAEVGTRLSRVVSPGVSLDTACRLLVTSGRRRLAVVDAAGTFRGLLCLKRTRQGFCSDADVRARARAARTACQ